eukprot:7391998-Prymnesium_polylepis.5
MSPPQSGRLVPCPCRAPRSARAPPPRCQHPRALLAAAPAVPDRWAQSGSRSARPDAPRPHPSSALRPPHHRAALPSCTPRLEHTHRHDRQTCANGPAETSCLLQQSSCRLQAPALDSRPPPCKLRTLQAAENAGPHGTPSEQQSTPCRT